MANKRITEQTETSTLSTGDYALIDNSSGGTKKYDLGSKLNTLTSNIGTLSSLTTTAKTNLVAAINEIKSSIGSGSSGSGTEILIITDTNGTLNKTVNEIMTALNNGTPAFVKRINSGNYIYRLSPVVEVFRYGTNTWRIIVEQPMAATGTGKDIVNGPSTGIYAATSTSAYPTYYTAVVPSAYASNDNSPT